MKRLLIASGAVLALGVAALCALRLRGPAAALWERLRYPPSKGPAVTPMGGQILEERRREWVRRISQDYARIRGKMDDARKKGLDVAALEPKLAHALEAARLGRYREALMLLNLVEVRIPEKRERVVPAEPRTRSIFRPRIQGAPVRRRKHRKPSQ